MKNIQVVPTDKPSRLYINLLDYLSFDSLQLRGSNQNIYITSDEEIKEGDWCMVTPFGVDKFAKVIRFKKENGILYNLECKKIILTTDQDLIKDGVQAIDDEFLEWFVKNPSCEEVIVTNLYGDFNPIEYFYEIIFSKEEPKQETTLEEVAERYANMHQDVSEELGTYLVKAVFQDGAKWQQEQDKKLYSEEDLDAFRKFMIQEQNFSKSCLDVFVKQFKKK